MNKHLTGIIAMTTTIAASAAPLNKLDTAPDSWFQHIALEVPGTEPRNEWLERVDDAAYAKATKIELAK